LLLLNLKKIRQKANGCKVTRVPGDSIPIHEFHKTESPKVSTYGVSAKNNDLD